MDTIVVLLVALMGSLAMALLLRRNEPPYPQVVYVQESTGGEPFSMLLLFLVIGFIVILVVSAAGR